MWLKVVAAGISSLALTLGASSQESPPVSRSLTLVSTRDWILAFAQDGPRIGWISSRHGEECPFARVVIMIRNIATRRQAIAGSSDLWRDSCVTQAVLALAGARAEWGGYDSGGNSDYGGIQTGRPGGKTAFLEDLTYIQRSYGQFLTGWSGDGPTLVYSVVEMDVIGAYGLDDCLPRCRFAVSGGGVRRVLGQRRVPVFGAVPAVAVAVAGESVALVPANTAQQVGRWAVPRASSNASVEIRNAITGEVQTTFTPNGTVVDLALTRSIAAVLVHNDKGARLEQYDTRKGTLLASNVVAARAKDLAIANQTIVYRIGRTIYVVDASRRAPTKVAVAKTAPIGLSIEGRRIAWAENPPRGFSRIRAVILPR